MSWEQKAKKIIGELCLDSYVKANFKNGKKYKKHRPYSVPELAQALVKSLDRNDEYEAKRLFIIHDTGALSLI